MSAGIGLALISHFRVERLPGPVAAVGHAALRWGTPAIAGPAARKLADQPSPWNTPIIAPPTSASLTAEEGGSASQDPPGLGDSSRKAWQEGCTQRIYGSLPTPIVSYLDPSPGLFPDCFSEQVF